MSIVSKNIYLISRWVDPVFAVGVGSFSYFLYERNHPRPEHCSLNELLQRKKDCRYSVDESMFDMYFHQYLFLGSVNLSYYSFKKWENS
ncbi:uncharacterized protein T551_02183 [Pneumocystis jirovecii RU7]|uniref:Uncharacterized protein n=1 Tax=Pneumocystis jirovecii (strain RU7) TaxID=1408657 RepID=A0A0W4ZMF5_PNEJ7|nr:uncharacterized protein T551_02183 [Pneumocystis jirovecii RU7]KTW29567.1 hypothetical protein T551_02183 [Pneumocystis jirovecii RU7]